MRDLCKYFAEVLWHKWFVLKFGLKIGKIPLWRLFIHDWTKFLPIESGAYVKRYIHGNCPDAEWKLAWNQMVADWMAADAVYSDGKNLQSWIDRKANKMRLHPETVWAVRKILFRHKLTWPLSES